MPDKSKPSDEVGYKKPPKHTRFKKGQSGNPKGRPKNARGLKTDLKAELINKMNIRMNGQDISGTKQQLMLRTLTVRAASGDISATRVLINLVMQVLGPEDHNTGPKKLSNLDQEILDQLLERKAPQVTTDDRTENAWPDTQSESEITQKGRGKFDQDGQDEPTSELGGEHGRST